MDGCPEAMTAHEIVGRHSDRMCDRVDPNAARQRTFSCGVGPRIVDWDSPLRTASRRLRSRHGRPLHSRFRGQVNAFGFKSWPVHEHRSLWAVWSPRAAGDPTGWWAPAGRPQAGHRPQGLHGVVRIPTARDSPARSDAAACCRSSDHSDQKTVVRRVQYPWHPLYGQDVIVRETRASRRVLRCQVDDDETRDNREIPLWMFDAVRCARMVPTSTATGVLGGPSRSSTPTR